MEEDIVVAHGCRKRKKLICGPEEEIVVAHGRLPSPARSTLKLWKQRFTGFWQGSIKGYVLGGLTTRWSLKRLKTIDFTDPGGLRVPFKYRADFKAVRASCTVHTNRKQTVHQMNHLFLMKYHSNRTCACFPSLRLTLGASNILRELKLYSLRRLSKISQGCPRSSPHHIVRYTSTILYHYKTFKRK